MTKEYLRQMSLVVSSGAQAIDFGQFWVTFSCRRGDMQTPNSLDARIYNVKPSTANTISQKEFTKVTLSAGYPGNSGLLFTGNIIQFRQGRVNQLDSYVDLTAADGDSAYNYATISTTVPAGSSAGYVADLLRSNLKKFSVSPGYAPNFPASKLIRGKVLYGMARDECRDFALQNECKWSIQDGALTFIPWTSYIQGGEIPVISVSTGLIGVPEQTQSGINIRTLLNPTYKVGSLVRLDSQINQFRFGLDQQSQLTNFGVNLQNHIAPNIGPNTGNPSDQQGLYYVMVANHTGDTRGQNWYTDLTCLSVDATLTNREQSNALLTTAPAPIQRYGGT
jgi:hypothetical protein